VDRGRGAVSRAERLYRIHAPFYDVTRRLFLPDRDEAAAALELRGGESVADFCCGTGLNFPALRRAGAGEIVGVDLTGAMLLRAARRDPSATLLQGDVTRLDPPARVDAAIVSYGLSLIPDWRGALSNLHRWLRPGGRLVILDFDRLRGRARPLDPAARAWFRLFGVTPGIRYEEALEGRFERVERRVRRGGWNSIIVARGARFP
jgi:ubiquinone/menaquinone biosynthesis C-methylase UbiE